MPEGKATVDRILDKLGEGGIGEVYCGTDAKPKDQVVLKTDEPVSYPLARAESESKKAQ